MERSGLIARQGRFTESEPMLRQAVADIDHAVEQSPDDLAVRMIRGTTYAQFPKMMNKSEVARDDLERVTRHVKFVEQPGASRARMWLVLGKLYARDGDTEKAGAAWKQAVLADPEGNDGKAASEELRKLQGPGPAHDSQGRRMPDHFPQLSDGVSPIIVAASVTLPGHAFGSDPHSFHPKMQEFFEKLQGQPGLLAVHRLTSLDHPGMLVILTWWKDKKALTDWYYSETHQGMMHWVYNREAHAPAGSLAGDRQTVQMTEASQIAMELFTVLPGGVQYGGGIGPKRPTQ